MELKILEQRPNPLMKRTEYRFEIFHAEAPTPSRDEVRAELAKATNAPKERVIVERLNARYGVARSRGEAAIYENSDAAKSIAQEHLLVRNGLKEKVAKSTTPAPEPEKKAEAPAPTPKATPEPEPAAAPSKPERKPEPPPVAPKVEKKAPASAGSPKSEKKAEAGTTPSKPRKKAEPAAAAGEAAPAE